MNQVVFKFEYIRQTFSLLILWYIYTCDVPIYIYYLIEFFAQYDFSPTLTI